MIGIEFSKPVAREVFKKLFENKILVGVVGDSTLRLLPPLIVQKSEIDLFINTLKNILEEV